MIRILLLTALFGFIAGAANAQTWEQLRDQSANHHFAIDRAVMECARVTENLRYIPNPNIQPKSIQQLFADGGGDCDDFTTTWKPCLISFGVPASKIEQRTLTNDDGSLHAVLVVDGRHVMSADAEHFGAYEISFLDLWEQK